MKPKKLTKAEEADLGETKHKKTATFYSHKQKMAALCIGKI